MLDMNNKRQNSRTVAPFNPDPRWPSGYFQILEQLGISERQWRFYSYWVHKFFAANPGRRRRDLGRIDVETFINQIINEPGIADWQVHQARDAIEIYYEQFRGIALKAPEECNLQSQPRGTSKQKT